MSDGQPLVSDDSERPSGIRRLLAPVLSFLVPGGGQVLANNLSRGVVVAFASSGIGVLAIASLAKVPGSPGVLLPVAGIVIWRVWCAYDAYRIAGIPRRGPGFRHSAGAFLAFFLVALSVDGTTYSFALRVLGGAWRLPSGSMSPALLAGDYIIAQPLRREPTRGDIVTFDSPTDSSVQFIKRIVAGPGDTVEMRDTHVLLNGRALVEPYAHYDKPDVDPVSDDFRWQAPHLSKPTADYRASRNTWGPLAVPLGEFFVLGDDRDNSLDSRYLGFVKRRAIRAIPTRIYFSRDADSARIRWSRIGTTIQSR
jgi:signal peptidase I